MHYTLGQAAKSTGKSKPTIAHAIKKGRISASRDELGQYQIDAAELHRVYPLLPAESSPQYDDMKRPYDPLTMVEMERLKGAVERLEALNRQLEGERDNLRVRLDAADEERRRTLVQLTALLTDQRAREAPSKSRWWDFRKNRS